MPKIKKAPKAPKIPFKTNNVEPPASQEYEIAWKLEYDRLTPEQKVIIDNARTESVHGVYTRHYVVDAFVKRVIALVEQTPDNV